MRLPIPAFCVGCLQRIETFEEAVPRVEGNAVSFTHEACVRMTTKLVGPRVLGALA